MEHSTETTSHHPERRRNKVFVTQNTEYHTRDGVCVRVRDRVERRWLERHVVLGHAFAGSLHRPDPSVEWTLRSVPEPGDRLLFQAGSHQVITSQLLQVVRPPREEAELYPSWTLT